MAPTRSTVVGSPSAASRAVATTPAARRVKLSSPAGAEPSTPWLAATASARACWQTAETGIPAALTSLASSSGRYTLIFGDITPR